MALCAESAIFGYGRWYHSGLEHHLPNVFVCHAEESPQDPRASRIELPHLESLALAGENPVKKHHLDHISKAGVLLHYVLDALL